MLFIESLSMALVISIICIFIVCLSTGTLYLFVERSMRYVASAVAIFGSVIFFHYVPFRLYLIVSVFFIQFLFLYFWKLTGHYIYTEEVDEIYNETDETDKTSEADETKKRNKKFLFNTKNKLSEIKSNIQLTKIHINPKKEESETKQKNIKNNEDNIFYALDRNAQIRENKSGIKLFKTEPDRENNLKNADFEHMFDLADYFLINGEIEKNQQLLLNIYRNNNNNDIGIRAVQELVRLYGKEVFRNIKSYGGTSNV